MKPGLRDKLYLQLMRDALQKIEGYTQGIGQLEFNSNSMVQDAVHMQLLVLGENVRRLSAHYKETHPQVAWQLIAGLRNVLAHEYEHIDLEEIWDVAAKDVPVLRTQIESLLLSFDNDPQSN